MTYLPPRDAGGDQAEIRAESALSLAEAAAELARTATETIAESHRLREQARIHRRAARAIKQRALARRSAP